MRVLEITGEPVIHGGQEAFIMNCIMHMDDEDLQIDIFTPYYCENDLYRRLLSERGGKVYEFNLPFNPGKSRRNLYPYVYTFLKNNAYDVVHIHSGSISALAYMAKAAKKSGIKKIIVHSHSTGVRNMKHIFIQCVFSHMMKTNPTHFCACSIDAGRMKFPRNVVKNQLIVLKNGIDIGRFAFDISKREQMRKRYGISNSSLVIGHVGRFTFEKNHVFIIGMFSKLIQQRDHVKLVLIGDGELRETMEKEAQRCGIKDQVIFAGAVDEVWNYYSMMDIFILPSLYEGFPMSAIEAQASGLPCILSTGVPNEIALCSNVIRIDSGDEKQWINAILDCANTRCTENADIIRKKGYSITDTVRQIVDIYRSTQ